MDLQLLGHAGLLVQQCMSEIGMNMAQDLRFCCICGYGFCFEVQLVGKSSLKS